MFTFHVSDKWSKDPDGKNPLLPTVSGQPALDQSDNKTLTAYLIPAKAKEPIERELRLLGINEFSIYGDLPSLAKRLKVAHEVK